MCKQIMHMQFTSYNTSLPGNSETFSNATSLLSLQIELNWPAEQFEWNIKSIKKVYDSSTRAAYI